MITVEPNTNTYLFRLLLLPFLFWLNYTPIQRLATGYYSNPQTQFFVCLAVAAFLLVLVANVISLLKVYKLKVEGSNNIISFYKPFKKLNISTNDIIGYYLTSFTTKWRTYEGLIIKMESGRSVEVSEYNVDSLYEFNQFLIKADVPFLGKKRKWLTI